MDERKAQTETQPYLQLSQALIFPAGTFEPLGERFRIPTDEEFPRGPCVTDRWVKVDNKQEEQKETLRGKTHSLDINYFNTG